MQGGLNRLERFADKRLSLTDSVSFELIDRLGLQGAFAFDRDFRDCGFSLVPENARSGTTRGASYVRLAVTYNRPHTTTCH